MINFNLLKLLSYEATVRDMKIRKAIGIGYYSIKTKLVEY